MLIDDLPCSGETNPGSVNRVDIGGPVKALKDVREIARRNAHPLIAHGEFGPLIAGLFHVLDPHDDVAPIRTVFHCVPEKVAEYPREPCAVPFACNVGGASLNMNHVPVGG